MVSMMAFCVALYQVMPEKIEVPDLQPLLTVARECEKRWPSRCLPEWREALGYTADSQAVIHVCPEEPVDDPGPFLDPGPRGE